MIDINSPLVNQYGLFGVFLITLISYSIIPFPSEAAIVASTLFFNPYFIFISAFLGSTFGVLTSYYLGFHGKKIVSKKVKSKYGIKARKAFDKYGSISILFFGWLPLIGDPLMIVAGTMEMKLWKFLIYSSIGRAVYFVVIIAAGKGLSSVLGLGV